MQMKQNVPKNKKIAVPRATPTSCDATVQVSHPPGANPQESAQQNAAQRSLDVLRCVADAPRAIALAEMSETLGLPKTTVHRICLQLTALRFLSQHVHDKTFSVGPELRALAFSTLNNGQLRSLRHKVLAELVSEVGETCNLTTLDGAEVLYLDRVEARWPLRLTLEVGSRVPIHCTASGKLFLAMLPAAQQAQILSSMHLEKCTKNTLSTKKALINALDDIARRGYSIDAEEFIPGLVALAVPIQNASGATMAALAIHAPTSRVPLKQIMNWLNPLRATAKKMAPLL